MATGVCAEKDGRGEERGGGRGVELHLSGVQWRPPRCRSFFRLRGSCAPFSAVFVKNIPTDWDDQQLRDAFTPFGGVEDAEVIKNKSVPGAATYG